MCRKAGSCVATRRWVEKLGAQASAGCGRWGMQDGRRASARQTRGRIHSRSATGALQAAGARQAGSRGARHGRCVRGHA